MGKSTSYTKVPNKALIALKIMRRMWDAGVLPPVLRKAETNALAQFGFALGDAHEFIVNHCEISDYLYTAEDYSKRKYEHHHFATTYQQNGNEVYIKFELKLGAGESCDDIRLTSFTIDSGWRAI